MMFVSVLERRPVGPRRALGTTRGQIRGQFLAEAVLLWGQGGLAATGRGLQATVGYATYQGRQPVIPAVALAGGALDMLAVLAGLRPSVRAARLTPTQALAST